MPDCLKCGADNRMGLLFCFRCGSKLDLSEPTAADLKIHKRSNVKASLAGFILLVAAAAVVLVGLMAWPQPDPLGLAPSKTGAVRVSLALRGMHLSAGVEAVGRDFRESDINAYLAEIRAKELGVDGLSMELTPGRIRMRMRHDDANWNILWMTFRRSLTRDITLKLVEGGAVELVSARIGHLLLPRAFAESTANRFRALFKGEREMLVLDRLKELEITEQAVRVVVGAP